MQDVQNIPPPDTSSAERDNDFGSHSELDPNLDNAPPKDHQNDIPLPSDQPPPEPIEEPNDEEKYPIVDDNEQPAQLV